MSVQIITSDLHLGSPYFRHEAFRAFLDALPADAELILAGDTIDDPTRELPAEDSGVLARLHSEAARRRVVLIRGNHDSGWTPPTDALALHNTWAANASVFVCHGDAFDNLMPRSQWFLVWFKRFHRLRVRLGAPPVHVAHYAKNWGMLYRMLRRNVMLNAVQHARENGFAAAVCGHVHFAEHVHSEDIDYFNTGSWTEEDFYYVRIDEEGPRLLQFHPE
ncbi:MAG: metallophosphoesterase [Verrucomicrobiota bacterium]